MVRFALLLLAVTLLQVASHPVADSNWHLVPDANGRLHLVNTNPYNLPEDSVVSVAPLFNPEQDLIFRLFTQANPTTAQVLEFGNPASIAGSNFNPANPTRFTIHGWNSNGNDGMNTNIRNRYLSIGEFNVISVDWSAGAVNPNYIAARNAVGPAGAALASFIDQLIAAGASPDNMYLIGFSLGAHVAGNAGKGQNGRVNTVIALDPAGPLFSLGQPDAVSPADGRYVEMIMTNGGLLGNSVPMGQATFTPNGGRSQPGCGTDIAGGCAHGRAPAFFAESITSSVPFRATRCAGIQEVVEGNCTPSGPDANMGGEPSNYDHGLASGKRTLSVGGKEEHTIDTAANVRRLSTHARVSTGGYTVVVQNLVVVATADRIEATLGRTDGLGEELERAAMRTGTSKIDTTARLATATVGVEVGLTDRKIETEQTTVGVDHLHVVGISRSDAVARIVDGEQRQSRIQGDDRVQTTTRHPLSDNTGSVTSETVSANVHVVEGHASALVEEVDEPGHGSSDSVDVVARRNVVRVLSAATPVHNDHVDISTIQVERVRVNQMKTAITIGDKLPVLRKAFLLVGHMLLSDFFVWNVLPAYFLERKSGGC
uniref:Lipase domain-containing protein n=1 Tax=Anopheles atroparvus TaxID=41427 RepID=A0AAG5DKA1_ANOAO